MRKPSSPGGGRKVPDFAPPGGRALERVRQDRLARGLGELPRSGVLMVTDMPSPRRPSASKKKAATAARATRRTSR